MNIIVSTTILASVLTPAFSFSYLDQLGGSPVAYSAPSHVAHDNGASYLDHLAGPAPVAAAPVAAAAVPAPAAPVQAYEPAPAGDVVVADNYFDSLSTGASVSGPGVMTHLDTLWTGAETMHGAGIQSYTANLPTETAVDGGAGLHTYVDNLGGGYVAQGNFSPFGSAAPSAGAASADGVAFTLQTGDISGLVQDLSGGGTIRLTGSINDISYD